VHRQMLEKAAMGRGKSRRNSKDGGPTKDFEEWSVAAQKGSGRRKFVFRYRDNFRGKLLPSHYEVESFMARVHEVTQHNDKYLSYHRTRSDDYLDFSAVDKHEKRQMIKQQQKVSLSKADKLDQLIILERIIISFQRNLRRLKLSREDAIKAMTSKPIVLSTRDKAAISVQRMFRGLLVRTRTLHERRKKRLIECKGAVRCGDMLWTEHLITRMGVKINAVDSDQRTLLHHAAATNQEEILVKLVELGADLDSSDADGNTPLHLACMKRYVDVSRRLVMLGADVESCNHKGHSPFVRPAFFLQSIVNEVMSLVSRSTTTLFRTAKGGSGQNNSSRTRALRTPDSRSSTGPKRLSLSNTLELSQKSRATTTQTARDLLSPNLAHTPRRAATTTNGTITQISSCVNTQLPQLYSNPPSPTLDILYKKRPATVDFVRGSAEPTSKSQSVDTGRNMFDLLRSTSSDSVSEMPRPGTDGPDRTQSRFWHHVGPSTNESIRRASVKPLQPFPVRSLHSSCCPCMWHGRPDDKEIDFPVHRLHFHLPGVALLRPTAQRGKTQSSA